MEGLDNPAESKVQSAIIEETLRRNGFDVKPFLIAKDDYLKYLNLAQYQRFSEYLRYPRIFAEKSLEHYIAARLLNLSNQDVFVDIACAISPASTIYHELYGCQTYRQDLGFPKGIHGDCIGGSADEMPIPRGFATKMALHCSFEHFEQNADIGFIKEASRVLREKGKLCIIPLYLQPSYTILTDPICVPKGFSFESDATLACCRGYRNRFGRIYDVHHFMDRIINNLGNLKLEIFVVQNEKEIDPACYAKFVAVFERE